MAKGGGEVEAVVSLVLAVGLIVTALVVTGKATDATRSVESEAFQLAHSLSGYLTSLATVEEGWVDLTLTHPLDIELFHMDGFFSFDRLREFLTNVRRLEVSDGKIRVQGLLYFCHSLQGSGRG
jgi:hypothetical protein